MNKETKFIIAVILMVIGVSTRLLPHAWNFAPIAAIALFSGVYLGKRYAIILPLVVMAISDLMIGFYGWRLMLAVYGSYALIGLLGVLIKKYKSLETVIAGSIVSSILFFLLTNWAVWQFSAWYGKSLSGLLECYVMALPFFRNTLLGDLFFVGILFGVYETVSALEKRKICFSKMI